MCRCVCVCSARQVLSASEQRARDQLDLISSESLYGPPDVTFCGSPRRFGRFLFHLNDDGFSAQDVQPPFTETLSAVR